MYTLFWATLTYLAAQAHDLKGTSEIDINGVATPEIGTILEPVDAVIEPHIMGCVPVVTALDTYHALVQAAEGSIGNEQLICMYKSIAGQFDDTSTSAAPLIETSPDLPADTEFYGLFYAASQEALRTCAQFRSPEDNGQ